MILFDLTAIQPIGSIKRHGGGKYGEVVLRQILKRGLPVTCYYDSKKWLNPDIKNLLGGKLIDLNDISLKQMVQQTGATAIYSALPQLQLFMFDGCKVIGTIHGLRRLETPADPQCFQYKNIGLRGISLYLFQSLFPNLYKRTLCKYKLKEWSNPLFHFVTVSNHSACSIKTYFPEFKDKEIPVFYSPSTSSNKQLTTRYVDRYYMLVSGSRPDKNNLRAIKALDMLFSDGYMSDFNVKITGAKNAANYRYKIKNPDRFKFMGYVDEDELEQLYHDAYALIYPSLNEGFGYPPLEAMHYGVPVIASPYTSIPEVCEGAALYFNPFSVEEIAARILYVSNLNVHAQYAERSLTQYDKVTRKQNEDLDHLVDYIYKVAKE